MSLREQDNLPYRSPVTSVSKPSQVTSDEQDYNTLQAVRGILDASIKELYQDFNAFDTHPDKLPHDAATMLLREIEAKQLVFNILSPLLERVNNAMRGADDMFKQRNNR